MFRTIIKALLVLWASPNSLLGIVFGMCSMCFGGRAQMREGCIEFYGGLVAFFLKRTPSGSMAAMTLGHTIVGQTPEMLDRSREHEHVHVRQYERWGPFFLPAYFGWSLIMWLRRKNPYLDNPFEVEAYGVSDPRRPKKTKKKH